VQITLLISLAMVVLTMALFLRRLAPTLIAAVTVPLSLAGAALVMYVMGFTLNNLSLLALVIAIGFVVDDAIVVIENIMRHLDEGMPRMQAALTGAREIGFTIVSITASLVAVFIPLLFASGMMGAFFREFTVTLVAAIVVSMIVSLTLTRRCAAASSAPRPQRAAVALRPLAGCRPRAHAAHLHRVPRLLAAPRVAAVVDAADPDRRHHLPVRRGEEGRVPAAGHRPDLGPRQLQRHRLLRGHGRPPAPHHRHADGRPGGEDRGRAPGQRPPGLQRTVQRRAEITQRRPPRNHRTCAGALSAKADRYPDLQLRLRAIQDLPSNDGGGSSQGAQYRISLQGNDLARCRNGCPSCRRN
jgi:multidrug efflux pump